MVRMILVAVALLCLTLSTAHAISEQQRILLLFSKRLAPTPTPSACTKGNLLFVYSDPCQLMSQMVGN